MLPGLGRHAVRRAGRRAGDVRVCGLAGVCGGWRVRWPRAGGVGLAGRRAGACAGDASGRACMGGQGGGLPGRMLGCVPGGAVAGVLGIASEHAREHGKCRYVRKCVRRNGNTRARN